MKVLVTGAAGFVGSYLVARLLQDGIPFVAFDRRVDGCLPVVLGERRRQVEVIQGDVSDLAHLARVVRGSGVDRVIHLAAAIGEDAGRHPGHALDVNVIGTQNILELGRIFGLARAVFAGTAALFGPPDFYPGGRVPGGRDVRVLARNLYEAMKIFNEAQVAHYADHFGVNAAVLRLLVYGYGAPQGKSKTLLDELLVKPMRGEPGRVPYGDDDYNFIHAEDVADALVRLLEPARPGFCVYNISGDYRPMRDAVRHARSLVPGADIEGVPGRHGWAWNVDDSELRRDTGYQPQWTLERGLEHAFGRLRQPQGWSRP